MTPDNIGAASIVRLDALWCWNTLERRPHHCTLDFYTKVQVWREIAQYLAANSSHTKEYPGLQKVSAPTCLEKKRGKK